MSRRVRIDPETAQLVEERLQWLLRENGPAGGGGPPASRPEQPVRRARRTVPPPEPEADPEVVADLPDRDDLLTGVSPARPVRVPRRLAGDGAAAALLTAASTFRRPHLLIVGVIVALGILLAGWAVLRARPVAVAVTPPPAAASPAGSTSTGAAEDSSPSPTAPSVVVHVLGAVKKPGLVTLTAGSRVQDALDAAGGLTRKADPGELNLAQQVADGQQIVVGTKGKPSGEVRTGSAGGGTSGSGSGSGSGNGSAGTSGQPVNLNTASQAELEELPGVGPVMAGKIIAWRTEHGRFSRVEELQEIDGVGPKTYAKLAPLCQV